MFGDDPIIQTIDDLDLYKPNMQQVLFLKHRQVRGTFAMHNRTAMVRVGDMVPIEAVREQFDHARTLRHTDAQIANYRATGLYGEPYLSYLKDYALPEIELDARDGQIVACAEGPLCEVSPWETIALAIVNELYFRAAAKQSGITTEAAFKAMCRAGEETLRRKGHALRALGGVQIIEFGTRRRAFRAWQKRVLEILKDEFPDLLVGTSNVALAREFGLLAKGTIAHEMFMAYACIYGGTDEGLRASHNRVLQDWEAQYGDRLSIALTDTFGTDFFLHDMTPAQAAFWRGTRQDSGDAIAFGEKLIAFYERLGIDPATKVLIPSDGLDVEEITRIHRALHRRIILFYGWGTNLTNDLGIKTLSLVMKLIACAGRDAVKLSDTRGKHMGPLAEQERYKRTFHYDGGIDLALVR
ncbi:MAG: hypothetical protein RLZZ324_561 [Candidatus Parcubacteria bacterium]|jgi:nicotinate phosphoribosyltransferase